MRRIVLFPLLVLLFAALTKTAYAQIIFSEIMYDPSGTDTGHEWVEIMNQGTSSIDLSQCKSKSPCRFIEAGNNHELAVVSGNANLAAGAYAIIANNPQTFLKDFPGYSGTLVDSSFSLKNTGETIAFKMPDGSISDTVTYTPDMGATGDGNSLQKINGTWRGAAPTPWGPSTGAQSPSNTPPSEPASASGATASQPTSGLNLSSFPVDPQIFADAGPHTKTVSAGAPVTFTGRVWGIKKEPIDNAHMTWTFGDGAIADGATVSHIYYYPGEYTAVLDVASGYYSASNRVRIMAVSPSLILHTGGDSARSFVAIENFGNDELDLSGWQIKTQEKTFTLPKNTLILAHKTLTIASEISGLQVATTTTVSLHFPNGTLVPPAGTLPATETKSLPSAVAPSSPAISTPQKRIIRAETQIASALNATEDTSAIKDPALQGSSLWMWYAGIALLSALATIGLRLGRKNEAAEAISADDFEIIEEDEE